MLASDALTTDYALPGIGPCIRLVNAQPLLPVLQQAMPGWALSACTRQPTEPAICVWQKEKGFWQQAPALPQGIWLETPVSTACSVIADVAGAFLRQHSDYIGLHCGAAEIEGQLVIFPESHRAGKSTFTAALAAAGYRVFGDDVVALTPEGEGMSLGIAPRLRLPLPTAMDEALLEFISQHRGPSDSRYGYLALDDTQLASHGEKSPVGAILLIDRDSRVTNPQLTSLQHGEGLWQLLKQNFADTLSDQMLIAKFWPLVQRIPCFLLRYSDAYQAAVFVGRELKDALYAQPSTYTSPSQAAAISPAAALERNDQRYWRARQAAHEYPLGDELFVIAEEGGTIHRMNVTSRAVWALLQHEAMSVEELSQTLVAFFMPVSLEQVRRDMAELLGQFWAAGLIEPATTR
ncbi:PqqD family protein [Halomonas sp. SpR8]|uniref:PqqD family protein n=1 Tax=Halomonas sp. SpR8 TaxID=3050463 RepID=UPI0027E420BA|nr:PqqD family protein [Halomonas sp. SpR8]MDQ7727630.1 PqqD family protein [Halomonas sp. SpR8]